MCVSVSLTFDRPHTLSLVPAPRRALAARRVDRPPRPPRADRHPGCTGPDAGGRRRAASAAVAGRARNSGRPAPPSRPRLPPPATVRSPPPPGPVARAVARVAAVVVVVVSALQVAVRAAWLAAVFAPLALSARRCLSRDPGHPDRAAWIAALRSTLERAGPAFIKYGQWAATRHDLFPRDLCSELERLHAAAPAHPRAVTAAAVASAFDASLDDLFDGFPDKPVASGSIGQVYRARLSDAGARRARLPPGTIVAVKVRHPGVEAAIARDFAIMMAAAWAATVVLPSLADARFAETLAQFELPLREQVDFEHEARSLWRFCYNFRDRDGVRFPQPMYPLVSPAVLVETFESGGAITEHVSAGPGGRYGTALARLGSDAVLHMLLVDNFVHADLVRESGWVVGGWVGGWVAAVCVCTCLTSSLFPTFTAPWQHPRPPGSPQARPRGRRRPRPGRGGRPPAAQLAAPVPSPAGCRHDDLPVRHRQRNHVRPVCRVCAQRW